VNLLIGRGANVSVLDLEGSSPLHKAAFSGGFLTAIYCCCAHILLMRDFLSGKADCVSRLLQAGADVELQDGEDGTPLHNAAFNGHIEVVKVLLASQANLNR
jgi:ankyrin repeat protein